MWAPFSAQRYESQHRHQPGVGDNGFHGLASTAYAPATTDIVRIPGDATQHADAGSDQSVCAATTTMAALTPAIGTGGRARPEQVATTVNNPATGITGLAAGNNVFRWTVSNGTCPSSIDDVTINRISTAPVANAGPDQLICDSTTVLIGNVPTGGATGAWTLAFGSGSILNPNNASTIVTGLGAGDNYFRWTISGGACPPTDDLVKITRSLSPTLANAGGDQTVCGTTATLTGNQPTVGTGTWTLVSGAGTIVSPNSFNTLVTGLGPGTNFFFWTIGNGTCPSNSDLVAITREVTPTTANAGPDQTLCGTTATLAGNIAGPYGGTWTLVSGAGSVTNSTLPGSGVTALGVGINTFRWTINNGACPSSFDDVAITRNASPTTANAGLDSTICGTTYTLNGNNPAVGIGTWTLVAGSAAVTSPNAYNSGVTSIGLGSNTFRWTISNGICPNSIDDVVIFRTAPPTPSNAGPNQTICDTNAILNADAPFVGTGNWTLVGGSGTILNPAQRNSNVSGLGVGANTFRWTVTNGTCPPSFDDVVIFRFDFPSAAFAGADQTICSDTVVLAGNVPTVGSGTWTIASGGGVIAVPTSPTSMVTALPVGNTVFTWTISNGVCPVRTDQVTITRDARPTVANAGPNQDICTNFATLTGNAPAIGTGQWTLIGGSGVIAQPTNFTTAVTNLGLGPNTFRWTISNGVCPPSIDDVVIARDNTPPVARCRNVTLYLDNSGVAPLSISQVDSSSSDNCAIATMSLNITTFLCSQLGSNGVIMVVADSNGNSASCTATITVRDSIRPGVTCPGTQHVLLNSNCAGALPNYLPLGTATDNCPPATLAQSPLGGSPINGVGPMTVTFTATDGSGNTSTCAFTVMKQDSVAPVVQCPIPHFLALDSNCTTVLPDYRDSTTAADNCTSVLIRSQVPAPGTVLSSPGYTTVVVSIADSSGNVATCGFSVLRRDLIAPQITCVDTLTVPNDSSLCSAVVVYAPPVGTDNCANPTTTLTSGLGSGAVFTVGFHPEVYTVRDSSGNTASCTMIVEVQDVEAPIITNCPPDITVSTTSATCLQSANWLVPSASDNCVLASLQGNYAPLDSFIVGVTDVVYVAMDVAGNSDTCTFTVTVIDLGPPVILCPADTAVIPPNWGLTAVVSYPAPSSSDACSPTTVTQIGGIASGGTFPAGNTLNTFVAADTSGNTDTCSFTVTVLQRVDVFPSCSDFTVGRGDWLRGGVNNSWEFGVMNGFGPDTCWATGLLGNYNNNERSWVQTPTYDFRNLKRPMAKFVYLDQMQSGSDGVVMQASTDLGVTWETVGGLGTGKKWYNSVGLTGQPGVNNAIGVGWSASAFAWTNAAVRLDHYIGEAQVTFRFQLGSDANGTTTGFALRDFCVQEREQAVLHEAFANNLQPTSGTAMGNLYDLINQNQLDAFMIEYHLQDALLLPQGPARGNYYQVPSTPWLQVDGTRFAGVPSNAHWNQDSIYHRIFEDPLFVFDTLFFDAGFPGGAITPTAKIRYTSDVPLGDSLSLQMVVIERVRVSPGQYNEWVMRQIVPLATGTTLIKQWRRDTTATVTTSWVLQNVASQAEVGVVAFVQNKVTQYVYQATYLGAVGPTVGGSEPEANIGPQVHVFPNPTSGLLHVVTDGRQMEGYSLVDGLGRVLLQGDVHGTEFDLNLHALPAGAYYLRVSVPRHGTVVKKVVLE
ncbi:MAG: HYR domain-containing protein [Bacteroidia bacterium]